MKLRVQLLSCTENPEKVIAVAAKTCYYPGTTEHLWQTSEETQEDFIQKLRGMGHYSPFEHATFTFGIDGVSRVLLAQLTRHRIASFCLDGDTVLYRDMSNRNVKKSTIKELYDNYQGSKSGRLKLMNIRCVDEKTGILTTNGISQVMYSGKKPVYKVTTDAGYSINSTLEHRFYTKSGWKQLKDISIGDLVWVNGIELYKDRDWLAQKYQNENISQEKIAILCGISKHTVRSWIRKHNLQKELGSWTVGVAPHNKGKNKNNYPPLARTSEKLVGNTNSPGWSGEIHPSWKGDSITIYGGYSRANRQFIRSFYCELCGGEGKEVHHIDNDPTNNASENLIELCVSCHKQIHKGAVIKKMKLSQITSIEFIDERDTYDIEMLSPHHNFVANGFIVHNSVQSQRYVKYEVDEVDLHDLFEIPFAILDGSDKTFDSYMDALEEVANAYENLVDCLQQSGLSKTEAAENARYILPGSMKTNLVMTMNARELMHFFELRCCNRAQEEIRQLAWTILRLLEEKFPSIFSNCGPSCLTSSCKEVNMSCKHPYQKELL